MFPPQLPPQTAQPAMAAPSPQTPPTAPTVKTTKDIGFWRAQIQAAITRRQRYEPWWEACLKAYAPTMDSASTPDRYGIEVHTNRTFTFVERKKADAFYQKPDVILQPAPWMDTPIQGYMAPPNPQTGQPAPPVPQSYAVQAHQELLDEHLGEDGIDATVMMDKVGLDIFCSQAIGFTKMGYESYTVDTPTGNVDPLTGKPETVPVPVSEKCFWEHFSGKQIIIPASFRSTEWDKAPFLGMTFELPLTPGNRKKYNLPPDFQGSKSKPGQQYYDYGDAAHGADDVFTGVELEYRSVLYREDVSHPDHLTQLILVDGVPNPVIERDSPNQTLTPQGGLTADSMIGFSIHPFSIRSLPDSAYPSSDGTMIRPLESELDIFRTQMIQFRDAQILRFIANGDILPPDALSKIVRSPIGGITVVPGEAFVGEGAIKPLEGGSMPRESFQSNDYIDNDIARTTGIDASGAGVNSETNTTATRDQIVSANANARMDKERSVLLKRYIRGVTKYSTLLQRYLPIADAIAQLGPQRAQAWDAWRKTANSALSFTAMPDSALRVDAAVDRNQAKDLYSFLANDPYIQNGRQKLLEKVLRKYHIDPTGIVGPPPPPHPELPKVSLAIASASLNPLMPEYANVYQVLTQTGYQNLAQPTVDPATAMTMQAMTKVASKPNPAHGGMLAPQESLSKHAAQETGAMQGLGGAAAPMGVPGGHLQ